MREIIFDTETTGLSPAGGDRMVEIGCVEMINRVETGRTFHAYFNPERPMPSEAEAVHGLGETFLSDKPRFTDTVEQLLEFIGDAPLIAHNATFDFGFLNNELQRCSRDPVCLSRMICTLVLARSRHPGAKHSLDALCTRFGVDRISPSQAWRAARRAIAGAGLCRADRWPPDRADPRRQIRPRPARHRIPPRPSARFGHRGPISRPIGNGNATGALWQRW